MRHIGYFLYLCLGFILFGLITSSGEFFRLALIPAALGTCLAVNILKIYSMKEFRITGFALGAILGFIFGIVEKNFNLINFLS